MFRLSISIGCFFLLTISVLRLNAQPVPKSWIGARIGADLGTFAYDPKPSSDLALGWKTGLAVGGEFDYWFSEKFAVSIQPSYIEKGAAEKITEFMGQPLGQTYEATVTFSYFQLPVLLKVTIGQETLKPYFFAGPSVGIKLAASTTMIQAGESATQDIADSEVTSTNFSLIGGVGITYAFTTSMMIFLESAYDFGLTSLNPGAGKTSSSESQNPFVYSRDIRISTGILFGL